MGKSLLAHALFHRFVSTAAIARNAPCPCGSGRRYKDCHGALGNVAAATVARSVAPQPTDASAAAAIKAIDALLRQAEERFARGEIAVAEATWQEVLSLDPGHPEALFHLGNRLRERGEHEAAIDHFERALERVPGHPGVPKSRSSAAAACRTRSARAPAPGLDAPARCECRLPGRVAR